jgi:hypothetical protein
MSRIRRLSQALSEEGRRALASQQALRIRDTAFGIVDEANLNASTSRKITKKAAFTVVLRSLQSTRNLPFSLREHMAIKELSQYITLAQSDKSNSLTLSNTDLLPISHPRSTRNHSMTASALTEARARWIADDPRIVDGYAKTIIASALTSKYASVEHVYYNSILSSLPQGVVPAEVIVAASNPFSGGNSSAERSLRARLQRRDREGKFAFMGGGLSALVRKSNGRVYNLVGRPIIDGPNGDDIQMELPDGKIVNIPASKGMFVKAIINPTSDGYSKDTAKTATTKNIINEEDLVFVDAPQGWSKTGTNTWNSEDGWGIEKGRDKNGYYQYEIKDPAGKTVGTSSGDWEDALDSIAEKKEGKKAVLPSDDKFVEDIIMDPPKDGGNGGNGGDGGGPKTPKPFEFKYPQGAVKIKIDESYDPEGRVDEESPDFTDDPVELGQKFDPRDLIQALEQGVLPENKGDNAIGYGVLRFNGGDEYVPVQALYNALDEAGEDAPLELARIYDKGLGNNNNENALKDNRKGIARLDQSKPDVAESFERTIAMSPDEAPATQEPKFSEAEMDESSLPPVLEGLSDAEMKQFMETGDHTPYLPENESIDMPEGYNSLDPSPFQSWREVTADTPDAVLPEGFSDNPVFLAQSIDKQSLETELRRSIEPNSATPGYANISLQDEDGEEFVANVPGEAVRDALQLQGVDTNELIKSIADEGFAGQNNEMIMDPPMNFGPDKDKKSVDEIIMDPPKDLRGERFEPAKFLPESMKFGKDAAEPKPMNAYERLMAEKKAERDAVDERVAKLKKDAEDGVDDLGRSIPEGWGAEYRRRGLDADPDNFYNAYGNNTFEATVDKDGKITVRDRNDLISDKSYDNWDDLQADLANQRAAYSAAARARVAEIAKGYGYSDEQIASFDSMSQQELADFFANPDNQTESHNRALDDWNNAWAVDLPRAAQKARWAQIGEDEKILAQAGDAPSGDSTEQTIVDQPKDAENPLIEKPVLDNLVAEINKNDGYEANGLNFRINTGAFGAKDDNIEVTPTNWEPGDPIVARIDMDGGIDWENDAQFDKYAKDMDEALNGLDSGTLPSDPKEIGKNAFAKGKERVPAADPDLINLMEGKSSAERNQLMKDWYEGWDRANVTMDIDAPTPKGLDAPDNEELIAKFKRQYVKEFLDQEEALADKYQAEEDMDRGDAQAVAEADMKRMYGKTAMEALNELPREEGLKVLEEREQQLFNPVVKEEKNLPERSVQTEDVVAVDVDSPNLQEEIQSAIDKGQKIAFSYNGKNRVVTPQSIWTNPKNGNVNLRAIEDGPDGGMKVFTLDKMEMAKSTTPPPAPETKPKELSEADIAVIKNNEFVEANAGTLLPTEAKNLQVGDFMWNAFFGRYEEILAMEPAPMGRIKFKVFNVYNNKEEDRYFEMDSPLRNVRRPGIEDEAETIPPVKAAPRGGKRGLIKRAPLSEQVRAKEGRRIARQKEEEGLFKDKNGVAVKPGDVVIHPKHPEWGRGVVKLRIGAQVREGKKAGGQVRAGVVQPNKLVVQFEGGNPDWVLNNAGRELKAGNIELFDGNYDDLVLDPRFRGGAMVPNAPTNPAPASPPQSGDRDADLFPEDVRGERPVPPARPDVAPEQLGETAVPAKGLPKPMYKAEVEDQKGNKFKISVIKIDDMYEAAVFNEKGDLNAVIAKDPSLGEVQKIVGEFIENVADFEDGEKVLRIYGDIPEPTPEELINANSPGADAITKANYLGELKKMRLALPKARADVGFDRDAANLQKAGKQLDKYMRNVDARPEENDAYLKVDNYELRQAIAYAQRVSTPLGEELVAKLQKIKEDAEFKKDAQLRAREEERQRKLAEPFPDELVVDKDNITNENLNAMLKEIELRLPERPTYPVSGAKKALERVIEDLNKGIDPLSLKESDLKEIFSGLGSSPDASHVALAEKLKPVFREILTKQRERQNANRQANLDKPDPVALAEERIKAGENVVDAPNVKDIFAKDDVFAANPFLEPFKEELQGFFAPVQGQPLAKLSAPARQALNQYLSGAIRDPKAFEGSTPEEKDKNIREAANLILALRAEELAFSPNRDNVGIAQGLKNIDPNKIFKYGQANASRDFVPLIIDGVDTGFLIKRTENGVNAGQGNNFWLIDTATGQKIIIKRETVNGRADAEVWAAKLLNVFGVRGISHVERHPKDDDVIFVTFGGDNLNLVETPNVYDRVRSKLGLDAKATAERARVADLVGMMVFDGVASNTDRHEENFLAAEVSENGVAGNGNENLQLIPIDHGYAHRLSRRNGSIYDPETLIRTNGFFTSREIYKELVKSIGGRATHHLVDLSIQQAIQELKRDNGGIDPAVLKDVISQLEVLRGISPEKWARIMGARD